MSPTLSSGQLPSAARQIPSHALCRIGRMMCLASDRRSPRLASCWCQDPPTTDLHEDKLHLKTQLRPPVCQRLDACGMEWWYWAVFQAQSGLTRHGGRTIRLSGGGNSSIIKDNDETCPSNLLSVGRLRACVSDSSGLLSMPPVRKQNMHALHCTLVSRMVIACIYCCGRRG